MRKSGHSLTTAWPATAASERMRLCQKCSRVASTVLLLALLQSKPTLRACDSFAVESGGNSWPAAALLFSSCPSALHCDRTNSGQKERQHRCCSGILHLMRNRKAMNEHHMHGLLALILRGGENENEDCLEGTRVDRQSSTDRAMHCVVEFEPWGHNSRRKWKGNLRPLFHVYQLLNQSLLLMPDFAVLHVKAIQTWLIL